MELLLEPFRGRLQKLVDFLQRLPPESIDMRDVSRSRSAGTFRGLLDELEAGRQNPEVLCGAACCLWGWTPAVFPEFFAWNSVGNVQPLADAGEICASFDPGGPQWYGLHEDFFYPYSYTPLATGSEDEKDKVLRALQGVLDGKLSKDSAEDRIAQYLRDCHG